MAFPTVIIDAKLCCPANAGFEDDMVYVGSGRGSAVRPSPWASPFGCSSCHNNFCITRSMIRRFLGTIRLEQIYQYGYRR